MTVEEERLYTQYFYNSVIEFIYFIILYLDVFKTASLNNLMKHVKLFKIEVINLISSFDGKTSENKLYQLLNTLECFVLFNDNVKLSKNVCLRNVFFEDLILNKCIDLILKGINNVDDICKNLNFNNVIFISKQNLLNTVEKYSYISVDDKMITLHHLHGLLGFENYALNRVISYFHNILSHCKILSVNEIENHSKYLTFCGNYNIMIIFSILNCSDQFIFKNGYVLLKEKSKKYPKQQPISIELKEAKFLSRSLPISQIVYNTYGPSLHKWSGEIGNLTTSSGNIYCVVDFTNGSQGIFCIAFNKASFKVISEIDSLEKYLQVRDAVEFDAEYYNGKRLDRCWKATRIKLMHNNKFEYDEILCEKLNSVSEQRRNQCVKCFSSMNCLNSCSLKVKNTECHKRQSLVKENKSSSLNYSLNVSNSVNNIIKYENHEITYNFYTTFYNLLIPDYVFMFGYIHMLMENEIVAIAKHNNKIYNILFLKACKSPLNKSQNPFVIGQKILTCIPYIKKMDSFPVAILVYGLNVQETNDTDNDDTLPEEFANKLFFQNNVSNLCNKFCSHHNFLKDLLLNEQYKFDLRIKVEAVELCNFIKSQYKISPQHNYLLQFLESVFKTHLNGFNFSNKVFHFMVNFSKYLYRNVNQRKYKVEDKRKIKNSQINFNSQVFAHLQKLCSNTLTRSLTKKNKATDSNIKYKTKSLDLIQETFAKEYMLNKNFCLKSKSLGVIEGNVVNKCNMQDLNLHLKSLDVIQKCSISLNSLNACSSSDSDERFYSCESYSSSPKCLSNCSLDKQSSVTYAETKELPDSLRIDPEFEQKHIFPKILYEDIQSLESSKNIKVQKKSFSIQKKSHHRYLGLHSVPLLKYNSKKKGLMGPYILKYICKNCTNESSYSLKAYISMTSKSLFFLSTNIDGHDVVLPMSKENIPEKVQENMKLKSSCEISVIPNAVESLSHIVSVKVIM